jgi:hypothetical protein
MVFLQLGMIDTMFHPPLALPLSFLTFCIELFAEHTHTPSPEVYRLFVKTGLLEMLVSDYEDLHGMSFEYLMQFFDEYLESFLNAGERNPLTGASR